MLQKLILDIQQDLHDDFTPQQLETLAEVLTVHLKPVLEQKNEANKELTPELLPLFIAAKRVEGCSESH